MYFFLIALAVVYNARVARNIGQSGILWGFITLVSFILCQSILGAILVVSLYKGVPTRTGIQAFLEGNPLTAFTIMLFGVGGALIIHYVLEQMGKKKPKP